MASRKGSTKYLNIILIFYLRFWDAFIVLLLKTGGFAGWESFRVLFIDKEGITVFLAGADLIAIRSSGFLL